MITKCRLCRSKKLKYALKLNGLSFVVCQTCTLLQRKDDIEIQVDFSVESFDYYPYILMKGLPVDEKTCVLFSLKSVEVLLELKGYKVIDAQTTDEGKLKVQSEPLNSLERIRLFEMAKKLQSQFTYFLWSIKQK